MELYQILHPKFSKEKKNTKQSDIYIYSVGMLMWEIFAGRPPFDDRAQGPGLCLKICEGLRPQLLSNMPADYLQMMQKCWDVDPSKRPTIGELLDFVKDKSKEIYENKDSETNFNENNNSSDRQQIHKSHPLAYRTSRILEDDIAKFKNLKINTSNDSSLNDVDINSIISNVEGEL